MLQYKTVKTVSRNVIRGHSAATIAASVERAAHAGTLGDDGRLPTIRELAASLRVSPVTVAAAYRLLQSRGLAVGQGRRGTRLSPSSVGALAVPGPRRPATGVVDLATGNPDPALLPPIGVALRSVSADHHLYGGPLELPALAAFAAGEFEADGIARGPVVVTSGGLDAIERVLREHVRPGDRVAVEDPTFPALLELLTSLRVTPEPFLLDDEGPRPDSFERAIGPKVQAIVVASRAQNPTGASVTARRAADLSRILRRRPDPVLVEIDDAGVVSGAPMVTLSSGRAHWAAVKSTSKFLGPDLRVAVMTGDGVTMARVRRRQAVSVRWVSHLLQDLALALWSDPSSGRRLARATEIYTERRGALLEALAVHGITAHGRSGFNVWIPVREEAATVQALDDQGWAVAPGAHFRLRSPPGIRVTTATLAVAEAKRFAADLAATARPSTAVHA
jgi:DNA-binding transcriptional MocR family regulator